MKPKISLRGKIFLIIGGLIVSLAILEIALRFGGFMFLFLQERRNIASIRQKGEYRIMCLGESTTALGGKDSYSSQLEEVLNQRNQKIKFSVINKGIPGSNTTAILSQLEDSLNKYKPNMVITMMGINDSRTKHIPRDEIAVSKLHTYLSHFKVYKLARFIFLHITAKMKEIRNNPSKKVSLSAVHLPDCYAQDDNSALLREYAKGTMEQNNTNDTEYVKSGWVQKDQGNFVQAEELFKRAIEINPKNEDAYVGLGYAYLELGNFLKMEESFKKAIELNPRNDKTYVILGHMYYCCLGKISKVEELFKKAIELNPRDEDAYLELGWSYNDRGEFIQSEKMFKKVIELNPLSDRAYGALATLCKERGEYSIAEAYYKRIIDLRLGYYQPETCNNYLKLKEILDKRNIKLVCVQYPVRSVEPLKKIFKNPEGIIFVDNQKLFKEALKKGSYKEYFTDMFGGDFGHCTRRGNRLLAENIANTILKLF